MFPAVICGFWMQNNEFGPELQVSMGPDFTCRFVNAKQRD